MGFSIGKPVGLTDNFPPQATLFIFPDSFYNIIKAR